MFRELKMLQPIQIIAIVVIIFLALVFAIARSKQPLYNDVMHGMWRGGDDFLEKAELSGMYIYIGTPYESTLTKDKRKAYIIMHNGEDILINKRIEIEITKSLTDFMNPLVKTELEQKVCISEFDPEAVDSDDKLSGIIDEADDSNQIPIREVMPENLTMYLNMGTGRLSFKGEDPKTGDDRLYAEMYKDAAASVDMTQ